MELLVTTRKKVELIDITARIEEIVKNSGLKEGICVVYVPHTTAGVTVNENYDPSVKYDIESMLSKLVPEDAGYTHMEGNADAHIKASIIGNSVCIPVEGKKLMFGKWQGIFFCEFDGPRKRRVIVKIIKT